VNTHQKKDFLFFFISFKNVFLLLKKSNFVKLKMEMLKLSRNSFKSN